MNTIYVTKYALTQGVIKCKAELIDHGMARLPSNYGGTYYLRGEFWLTEDEARADFDARKKRMLASIERSAKKVREAVFAVRELQP